MRIYVKRLAGGRLQLLSGPHRLRAALEVHGVVTVEDVDSGERFAVHDVDGVLTECGPVTAAPADGAAAAAPRAPSTEA